MRQNRLINRWRAGQHSHFVALNLRQHFIQIKGQHRQDPGATNNRRQPTRFVTKRMKKWADDQVIVAAAQPDGSTPGFIDTYVLSMPGNHALGCTGGTRCKTYIEGVFGADRRAQGPHFSFRNRRSSSYKLLPTQAACRLALQQNHGFQVGQILIFEHLCIALPEEFAYGK